MGGEYQQLISRTTSFPTPTPNSRLQLSKYLCKLHFSLCANIRKKQFPRCN